MTADASREFQMALSIRPAVATDAAAMADLLTQLGYPATADEVVARLARLEETPGSTALVAEHDGRVVGLVTGHVFRSIHATEPVAWLTALTVDARHHQKGIGRQLCAAMEEWSRRHGAARVSVTSGKHREGAHAFYENIGYERTGVRLTKVLV